MFPEFLCAGVGVGGLLIWQRYAPIRRAMKLDVARPEVTPAAVRWIPRLVRVNNLWSSAASSFCMRAQLSNYDPYHTSKDMRDSERVRIRTVKTLSDDWYVLKKTTFDYQMTNGSWKTVTRETYDRGNGATILLFDRERGTVLLTRQFRFPAYVNGLDDGLLVETCAGLLDNQSPEAAIRREAEEELGVRVGNVHKVLMRGKT